MKKRTIVAQQQFGFFVLVKIRGRYQMSFSALLNGEQPVRCARAVVDNVELVFVAHANTISVRVAGRLD